MYYPQIDLDQIDLDTSTVVLCDVYCCCPISTAVLTWNTSSLDTSIGYGCSMRFALLG